MVSFNELKSLIEKQIALTKESINYILDKIMSDDCNSNLRNKFYEDKKSDEKRLSALEYALNSLIEIINAEKIEFKYKEGSAGRIGCRLDYNPKDGYFFQDLKKKNRIAHLQNSIQQLQVAINILNMANIYQHTDDEYSCEIFKHIADEYAYKVYKYKVVLYSITH